MAHALTLIALIALHLSQYAKNVILNISFQAEHAQHVDQIVIYVLMRPIVQHASMHMPIIMEFVFQLLIVLHLMMEQLVQLALMVFSLVALHVQPVVLQVAKLAQVLMLVLNVLMEII